MINASGAEDRPRAPFESLPLGVEGLRYVVRAGLRRPLLTAAGLALLLLILIAVLGPVFWSVSPNRINLLAALQAPSASHPMGTDEFGRDVFARFVRGAQISLAVGAIVIVIGAAWGGLVGLLAGVLGSWRDVLLMRTMDAILAFPPLILAMAVTVGLGTGIVTGALGITIASVPWYARVVRSEVVRVRNLPFVEAAVAAGASRQWILRWHILPAVLPTLVIQAAAAFGYSILALAALGFVGLGAQIPTPEWGAMITDGLQYTLTGQWWIDVFPGLGLLFAATAANVIADGFRDALDPRGEYARV